MLSWLLSLISEKEETSSQPPSKHWNIHVADFRNTNWRQEYLAWMIKIKIRMYMTVKMHPWLDIRFLCKWHFSHLCSEKAKATSVMSLPRGGHVELIAGTAVVTAGPTGHRLTYTLLFPALNLSCHKNLFHQTTRLLSYSRAALTASSWFSMFLKALVGLSDKGTRVKIQLHICVCGFILYASCHLHQYHLWESLNYGLLFCSFGLWDTCLCNAADMNWADSYTLLTGKTKTGAEVCAMHRTDNTTANSLAKWLLLERPIVLFFIYLVIFLFYFF